MEVRSELVYIAANSPSLIVDDPLTQKPPPPSSASSQSKKESQKETSKPKAPEDGPKAQVDSQLYYNKSLMLVLY